MRRHRVVPLSPSFTHLFCQLSCARCTILRGRSELPCCGRREPRVQARCQTSGIDLQPEAAPALPTTHAVVHHSALRTFSRADAAEPSESLYIRVSQVLLLTSPSCRNALMHWAPLLKVQGVEGIAAWPQWICMRCQDDLHLDHIRVPDPRPKCLQ